jgi:hypothetical protein
MTSLLVVFERREGEVPSRTLKKFDNEEANFLWKTKRSPPIPMQRGRPRQAPGTLCIVSSVQVLFRANNMQGERDIEKELDSTPQDHVWSGKVPRQHNDEFRADCRTGI